MINPFLASPEELRELTDGEVLDLIYQIARDPNLDNQTALDAMKRVIEDSGTTVIREEI
jgi:hypothetical protein